MATESKQYKILNIASLVIRIFLTILTFLIIAFAVMSGSEDYGGGLNGVLKNSPNALPWLLLLAPVIIAWMSERIGGILLCLFGLVLVFFFNTGANFFWSTFFATLSIPISGSLLWLISYKLKSIRPTEE